MDHINRKIDRFIKRFYFSALIKGALLFFGLGLIYILFWVFIEHLFWLPKTGRTLIFWLILVFEGFLFYKFILAPILKYFKVLKGISYEDAATLIGEALPEVDDRLLNTIQLKTKEQTDLLLASLEKREIEFRPFLFEKSINLKDNIKYLKYALAPILILIPFYLFGKQDALEGSLRRVVDYNTVYTKPPPFVFKLDKDNLSVIQGETFSLNVEIVGDLIPADVQISFADKEYYLKKINLNSFSFNFPLIDSDLQFQLFSGPVKSKVYNLKLIKAPLISNANLILTYPKYTNKAKEKIENFGNIRTPRGTKVTWDLSASSTKTISFFDGKSTESFVKKGSRFFYNRHVFSSFDYRISTSNEFLSFYEPLDFSLEIIDDEPPVIEVEGETSEKLSEVMYFYGQMSDDYGITALRINYYPAGRKDLVKTIEIRDYNLENLTFSYVFPGNLELNEGRAYDVFFEVFDNNPFPSPNRSKSKTFRYLNKSTQDLIKENIKIQEEAINEFKESRLIFQEQETDIDSFKKLQSQSTTFTFTDQQRISELLNRQKRQDDILKRFNEKINQSLNQFDNDFKDPLKEEINRRLHNQEDQLKKNEKLIEEIRNLSDKLDKDAVLERIDRLASESKSKQRSLKQMFELTKRYYVRQKAIQLKQQLKQLSESQTATYERETNENSIEAQMEINRTFNDITNDIDSLLMQNSSLSKPLPFYDSEKEQESIKSDQSNAVDNMINQNKALNEKDKKSFSSKAKKFQKKSAQKMSELSEMFSGFLGQGGQQQLIEDASMLRQILDNLLLFSFEQEALMLSLKRNNPKQINYATMLLKQNEIKNYFEHIDDSLFVLSLRQPLISEKINSEVSEVLFNMDKSLDLLANSSIREGLASQQYALTSANNLANILSNILSSMEMEISPGQGEGDMQLPDIIMNQAQLNKDAQDAKNKTEQGSQPNGQEQGKSNKLTNSIGSGDKQQNSSGDDNSLAESYFDSEESGEAIMKLYKKQQQLRQVLEAILKEKGLAAAFESVTNKMKNIEQSLINQGVTDENISLIKDLKYELLKLEAALNEKGQDERRESKTNNKLFNPSSIEAIESLRQKFNSRELLNRQELPLQDEYMKRVLDYFNKKDDNFQ